MATKSLSEAQPHEIRGLLGIVVDFAAQLDRLKGVAIGLQDVEAQTMPINDRIDLSCDRIGDVADGSRPAELRGQRLDALELLAPAASLCEQPCVVHGEADLTGYRNEPIGLGR